MGVLVFVKWVFKQYTLRIVLIVLVVLLLNLYSDYLTPSKEYILQIIPQYSNDDVKPPIIDRKIIDVTVKPPVILHVITPSAATTTTTATSTSKEKIDQDDPPHIKIFDLNGPSEPKSTYDAIVCRKSAEVYVTTTLCVHDLARDVHVSGSIYREGVWERHIISPFMEFINANPDLLVLDVGAQIGQYSLFPASLGRYVLTVEPFIDNIYRLHKAAKAESIQNKITLIQNAVSNKRNEIKLLQEASDNIGGQSLLENKDKTFNPQDKEKNRYLVETILLDDIVPYLPKKADGSPHTKAIMKIDIEGFEPYAFQHASKLFNTLDIPIVYMEWGQLPKQHDNKKIIIDMIDFFYNRTYSPWGNNMVLQRNNWQNWPWDIIWKK